MHCTSNPGQNVEQAGTHNMFQKDMELLNNSETVMISVHGYEVYGMNDVKNLKQKLYNT